MRRSHTWPQLSEIHSWPAQGITPQVCCMCLRCLVFGGSRYVTGLLYVGCMGNEHPDCGGGGLSGYRMRAVLPSAPASGASLVGLEELMRSATQVKAQAESVRAGAAAEYRRHQGQAEAERVLREQSGQSARGCRAEVETATKLKDLPVVSDAFGKGQVSYDHARIIAKTAERTDIDEQELVDLARKQPVDVFAGTARKHERDRSGDDGVSRLEQQRQERCGRIKTDPADGMTVLWARFDPIRA